MAKFCKRCGKPLDPNGRCPGCGYQDASSKIRTAGPSAAKNGRTPSTAFVSRPVEDRGKKTSNALKWVIVGLLAVLVLLMAFFVIKMLLDGRNTSADPPKESETPVETGHKAGKFEEKVRDNDYQGALEVYEKKISGNSKKEVEAAEFLEEYLEAAWQSYLDETMSKTDFDAVLQTVQKIDRKLDILGRSLSEIENEYPEVSASKEAYQEGIKALESGDYEVAMTSFAQVSPSDTNNYEVAQDRYEDAAQEYQNSVLEMARNYAASGDIYSAADLVYEAEYRLGATDELEAFLRDAFTSYFSDEIANAYSAGDYLGAIRAYRDAQTNAYVQTTADMSNAYSQSVSQYLADVDRRAAEAFGESKNYEAAISVIRAAIAETSDVEELVAQLEAAAEGYRTYIPVPLTSLDPVQHKTYISIGTRRDEIAKDVNGTSYTAEQIIYPSGGSLNGEVSKSEDDAYLLYNLNFQYSTFTAVLYRPYISLSASRGWDENTTVKIYADDVLIYEAPNFNQYTYDNVIINLDVSGVRNLKIVMRGTLKFSSGDYGLYNYYPKVCITDACLQK